MAYSACYTSLLIPASGGGGGGPVPNIRQVLQAGNDAQGTSIFDLNTIQATGTCTLDEVDTTRIICTGQIGTATLVSSGLATLQSVSTTTVASSGLCNLQSLNTQAIQCSGILQAGSINTPIINPVVPLSIQAPQTNFTADVAVAGDLVVIGDCALASAELSGNLIVDGNCAITGTLSTTGAYTPASISTASFTLGGSPYPAFPQPDATYGVGVVKIFANGSGLTVGNVPAGSVNFALLNVTPPAGVYMLKTELDLGCASAIGFTTKLEAKYNGVSVGFQNLAVSNVNGVNQTCIPMVALFRSTGLSPLILDIDALFPATVDPLIIALDSDVSLIRLF